MPSTDWLVSLLLQSTKAIKCFPAVLFTVFYSSHRAICRPSDRTLRRFRDEIRTRDGGPQVPGRFEPKAGGGLEPVMKIMYYFYSILFVIFNLEKPLDVLYYQIVLSCKLLS